MKFYKKPKKRRLRINPLYGDSDLFLSMYNSDFWKLLFTNTGSAFWLLVRNILQFKVEMFASSVRFFLRVRPGRRTTGFVMAVLTTVMITAFNSTHLFPLAAPYVPFVAPVVFYLSGPNELWDIAFTEVRSHSLLVFMLAFAGLSILQAIAMNFMGWHNRTDLTKRGDSILYLILGKCLKINGYKIQLYFEPLLVGAVGYYFWEVRQDLLFAVYLATAASCLLLQELLDEMFSDIMK